jgi:hypothetical protein
MNSLRRAGVVALILFGASVIGMLLEEIVPPEVLTSSKASVGAMSGLVTLLLALVLGLLVYTAFAVFSGQQADALSLGPVIAEIDIALERYGPEAGQRPGRTARRAASLTLRFFGGAKPGPQMHTFEETKATLAGLTGYFDSLKPATDDQRSQLSTARGLARQYQDTQMKMARQLAAPFPPYVIAIVVCWAAALFLGNGLVAAPNAVSVLAHLVGAVAIASAIFLILELSSPYTGVIRLSPDGLDRVIAALGEANAKSIDVIEPAPVTADGA